MLIPFINKLNFSFRNILFSLASSILLNACLSSARVKEQVPVAPQAEAAYHRAVIAMKAGENKRAFRLFNSISKKYPGFSGPQLNIGLIHLRKNRLKKAETAFKRAIHINRDNAVGHNLLGVVYRHSGKFVEAKEAYIKALSKNSKYANAHLNLGILYDLYLANLKQALYHYEQYQKLSDQADANVAKWIIDLKRRSKTVKTTNSPIQSRRQG